MERLRFAPCQRMSPRDVTPKRGRQYVSRGRSGCATFSSLTNFMVVESGYIKGVFTSIHDHAYEIV